METGNRCVWDRDGTEEQKLTVEKYWEKEEVAQWNRTKLRVQNTGNKYKEKE